MNSELGTRIACHMHKDGYGIRIGKFNNGDYVVQFVSPHPVYKEKLLVVPMFGPQGTHKTEAAARKRANIEWINQRRDARGEKPLPTDRWR